jgi:hypothetical protein
MRGLQRGGDQFCSRFSRSTHWAARLTAEDVVAVVNARRGGALPISRVLPIPGMAREGPGRFPANSVLRVVTAILPSAASHHGSRGRGANGGDVDCAVGEGPGSFTCATLGAALPCSEYHIEAVDACLVGAPPISRAIHSARVVCTRGVVSWQPPL